MGFMFHESSDRVSELAAKHLEERTRDPLLSDNLEYAGHGGESVVFRVRQKEGREGTHRGAVLKADMYHLKRGVLREAFARWEAQPFPTADDAGVRDRAQAMHEHQDEREAMKEALQREAAFMTALRRSFPASHLLTTRATLRDVPVTPEVAKAILEHNTLADLAPASTIRVPTIVHYQETIPEAARTEKKEEGHNPDVHSFGFRYVERYDIPVSEYQRLNRMAFSEEEPFDASLFYKFLHVGTIHLLEEAAQDHELADVLRDLTRRLMAFTVNTHEMLDMAGGGNVRVYRNEEGKWTYLIVDPFGENEWTGARTAAERLLASDPIDQRSSNDLLNATNYARTLNGMAKMLGMKERLDLLPGHPHELDERSGAYLASLRTVHHWPDKRVFSPAPQESEQTVRLPGV